jgi:hypothetical protein
MISLMVVFYIFLVIFGIIGSMRGWAKEMLIIFSVILALALIAVIEYLLPLPQSLLKDGSAEQFWFRTIVLLLLVFFGYQSPKLSQLSKAAGRRDMIQETLLGLFFGLLSGYMVVGSLWSVLHTANYLPLAAYVISPDVPNVPMGQTAMDVLKWMPPALLLKPGNYMIYALVVLAFIFVIVVFI